MPWAANPPRAASTILELFGSAAAYTIHLCRHTPGHESAGPQCHRQEKRVCRVGGWCRGGRDFCSGCSAEQELVQELGSEAQRTVQVAGRAVAGHAHCERGRGVVPHMRRLEPSSPTRCRATPAARAGRRGHQTHRGWVDCRPAAARPSLRKPLAGIAIPRCTRQPSWG